MAIAVILVGRFSPYDFQDRSYEKFAHAHFATRRRGRKLPFYFTLDNGIRATINKICPQNYFTMKLTPQLERK